MLPSLRPGDSVVIWRGDEAEVGDVVVAKIGHAHYIKRVARVSGESYYLLSDNPEHSVDSRRLGLIGKRHIVGRVFFVKRFDERE